MQIVQGSKDLGQPSLEQVFGKSMYRILVQQALKAVPHGLSHEAEVVDSRVVDENGVQSRADDGNSLCYGLACLLRCRYVAISASLERSDVNILSVTYR